MAGLAGTETTRIISRRWPAVQVVGLRPYTVERHRSNLLAKLKVHNKAKLIQYAIRQGLVRMTAPVSEPKYVKEGAVAPLCVCCALSTRVDPL